MLVQVVGESGWPPYVILVMLVIFYVILGCFMDALPMLLLTLPFVFPLVLTMNFDPIWFGVIMVSVVGMNLFVIMATTPGLKLQTISRGVVALLMADVARIALLILFPALSLWLPSILMD